MRTTSLTILALVATLGCRKADEAAIDLHPAADITVRATDDGLERLIKIYVENVGDPWRFKCEASSVARLLEFVSAKAGYPNARVSGAEYVPSKTYRIDFHGRTWSREADLVSDLVAALELAFRIKISFQKVGETNVIKIKPNNA